MWWWIISERQTSVWIGAPRSRRQFPFCRSQRPEINRRARGERGDASDSAAAKPSDIADTRMPETRKLRDALRRLIKFLHAMGAIAFIGSLAFLLVLARLAPPSDIDRTLEVAGGGSLLFRPYAVSPE